MEQLSGLVVIKIRPRGQVMHALLPEAMFVLPVGQLVQAVDSEI